DARTIAVMSDFGMNVVGKIQRCGTGHHVYHMAFWRKYVNPVFGQCIAAQLFGQTTHHTHFVVPGKNLAQPFDFFFKTVTVVGVNNTFLVTPVCTDTKFCIIVHYIGANLDFYNFVMWSNYRGMQGLVAVFLGVGDVVVEFVWNHSPHIVHNTERGIAVAYFRHQYPDGADIVDLGKIQLLALHLAPDTVDAFGAAVDFGINTRALELATQFIGNFGDKTLAVYTAFINQAGNTFVVFRLQISEREVFEFPFQLADTQSVSQRRVDVKDFAGDPATFFLAGVFDCPDGAGTLGQLDQRNPHVINHGQQHLADVFDLVLVLSEYTGAAGVGFINSRHAQYAFQQSGNVVTKLLTYLLQWQTRFTHRAIKQRHQDGIGIQTQLGENFGHLQAGTIGTDAWRPDILCGNGLLLNFPGQITGTLELFVVSQRHIALQTIQPLLKVDTAVRIK